MLLRDVRIEDAEALHQLNKNQLGYDVSLTFTRKQLTKLLNDSEEHFFLAWQDTNSGELCGYVHAHRYESLVVRPACNILALAVSKDHEKQGIGRLLMQGIENEATKRGFDVIRLNSGALRIQAHHFYEKLGYVSHKTQKQFIKELK